jgi:hypothetical protein
MARGQHARAAAGLALSVAAKLIAAPLLLLQTRGRMFIIFAAVLLALYVPFLTGGAHVFGSLAVFSENWESNGSIHALVAPLLGGREYRIGAGVALIVLLVFLRGYRVGFVEAAFAFFFAVLLLSPVVHPWYLLWLLVFLPLRRRPLDFAGASALVWSTSVVLSYSAQQEQLATGLWRIPQSLLFAEYLPVYVLLIIAATILPFSQMKLTPMTRKNEAKT